MMEVEQDNKDQKIDAQVNMNSVDVPNNTDKTKVSIITISDDSEEEKKDDSRMEIEKPIFSKDDHGGDGDDDANNYQNTLTLSKRSSIRMNYQESLYAKLEILRKAHLNGEINLNDMPNLFDVKSQEEPVISFSQLLQYLAANELDLDDGEKQILLEQLCAQIPSIEIPQNISLQDSLSEIEVNINEFIDFMNLKDTFNERKKSFLKNKQSILDGESMLQQEYTQPMLDKSQEQLYGSALRKRIERVQQELANQQSMQAQFEIINQFIRKSDNSSNYKSTNEQQFGKTYPSLQQTKINNQQLQNSLEQLKEQQELQEQQKTQKNKPLIDQKQTTSQDYHQQMKEEQLKQQRILERARLEQQQQEEQQKQILLKIQADNAKKQQQFEEEQRKQQEQQEILLKIQAENAKKQQQFEEEQRKQQEQQQIFLKIQADNAKKQQQVEEDQRKQQEQQQIFLKIQAENAKKQQQFEEDQRKQQEQQQIFLKIQAENAKKIQQSIQLLAPVSPPLPTSYPSNPPSNDWMSQSVIRAQYFEEQPEVLPGLQEFINKFKKCHKNNEEFIDAEFPPSENSIASNPTSHKYQERRKLGWYRADSMFGKNQYKVFGKLELMQESRLGVGQYIQPTDIQQGTLGDCYFLVAISCLALEPHRITNLFLSKKVNKYGIYCIKICYDGEWQYVTIDDHIPCYNNRTPAFTKAVGNELWVPLLEKAWAKLFNSYSKIEAGHCHEALRDLTGAPTTTLSTFKNEMINGYQIQTMNKELMGTIKEALSETNRFLVTATNDESDLTKSQADRLGLVTSHAYSVLGTKEVQHSKLGKVQLVKLRNPWGKKEWNGDWSDGSPLWEGQERSRIISRGGGSQGIFYMSVNDFYKYFTVLTICYYHDFFAYESIKVNNKTKINTTTTTTKGNTNNSTYLTATITEKGKYYFSIIQKSKRNYEKDFLNYQYSNARLLVVQVGDSTQQERIRYITGIQKQSREIFCECELDKGVYVIQAKVFWENDDSRALTDEQYVISSYGVEKVNLEMISKEQLPLEFFNEAFKQLARKSDKLRCSTRTDIMKTMEADIKTGYGFYYCQNISENISLNIQLDFSSSYGIKFKKPFKLPMVNSVVQTNTEFIIVFTVSNKGYSIQFNELFKTLRA